MAIKIAINGFGRIGRMIMRIAAERGGFDVVAVNDLTDPETLAHLLQWDSVHGKFSKTVEVSGKNLMVDGDELRVYSEKDPSKLPWKELKPDVVLECTGIFRKRAQAMMHIDAGAPKVVISAPATEPDATIVMGINHHIYNPEKHHILSNASCTTNCLAPVAKVLHTEFGIKHGLMTTIHAYTNDQRILDLPHKDLRRARAAGMSMIPTSTGAAKAVGLVLPELNGKLDGFAIRVPTPNVSVVDLSLNLEKDTSAEEINTTMKKWSEGELKGILGYEPRPLVSIDFNDNPHSSIFDPGMTRVMDGRFAKVISWYDNEWGFSQRMLDLVKMVAG